MLNPLLHLPLQRGGQAVLENVSEDGEELSGCLGRHQNPGEGWGGLQMWGLPASLHTGH